MENLAFKKLDTKILDQIISISEKRKYNKFFSSVDNKSFDFSKYITEYLISYVDKNLMKTFITDINNKRINNKFISQNKTKQYVEFINDLEYITKFKEKNILLFNNLKIAVQQIIESYMLFIKRFNKDELTLEKKFNVEFPLKSLDIGLGDSHNKHSQVIQLIFSNNKKIIYKPRNSFGDLGILYVTKWLRKHDISSFYMPEMEIHDDYSWNEGIEYIKTNSNDLENIYFQFGTLVAVAHMFKISDLHMENIIISNGKVYLIDCETIFQDNFYLSKNSNDVDATEYIYNNLRESVLMTNLFPAHLSSNETDLSGICGHGGQVFKHRLSKVINVNSSDIKLIKTDYINQNKKNLPKDVAVDPREYVSNLISGFKKTIEVIKKDRKEFMQNNFWEYFMKGKYRIIFKNTSTYNVILNTSSNPLYFRNKQKLHNLLDLLKKDNNNTLINKKIFNSEVHDLCNGDVPFFYKKSNGNSVFNSEHDEVFSSSIFKSIDFYRKKMIKVSKEDIDFQIKLIKISMAKPIKNWDLGGKDHYTSEKLSHINSSNNQIINEANRILNQIIDDGVQKNNFINWYNVSVDLNNTWVISPCNYYLFNGLTGILLVFALAYEITGRINYKQILNKGLNELLIFENKNINNNISVFNGIGSFLYFYFYLYLLTNKKCYLIKTKRYIEIIDKRLDKSSKLDLIDGVAGILTVLCNIKKKKNSLVPITLIKKCANLILDRWDSEECWSSDIIPDQHLNGMSHGLSGITYALFLANIYLKDTNINNKILTAINLENQSINNNNWIDLRNIENRKKKGFPDPIHWCHGAPGIGLSRIVINHKLNNNILKNNIKMAKEKTLLDGFGGSDCLCHGNLGNIDLFITDYIINKNKTSLNIARKIVTNLCRNQKGWICGIPQHTRVDNLMTGTAGIVYELFRTVYPEKIPSILLLDF